MHHVSAVDAGARSDVHDPVGRFDGVFVVFDHDERVAEITQGDERLDQSAVVALVQADAWFIENVEHPGEAGPDLRGQADALRLTARERRRCAGEVEVVEPNPDEKVEARANLAQNLGGDGRLPVGQGEFVHELTGVAQTERADIRNARVVHEHGEHLGLEAGSFADVAVDLAQVFGPALTLGVALGLQVLAFDIGHDTLETGGVAHFAAVAVLPLDAHFEVVAAHDGVLHLTGQVAPRRIEREVQVAGEAVEQFLVVLEQPLTLRGPGQHDTLGDAQVGVTEQQVFVDGHAGAEAGALRAGTERGVEREGTRFDFGQLHRVVVRAGELLGVVLPGLVALFIEEVDLYQAIGEFESCFERVGETAEQLGAGDQAVDNDGDVVFLLLLERGWFAQLNLRAVDDRAGISTAGQFLEQVDELALLLRDDRADHLVADALLQLHQLVGDLLHGLRPDDLAADGAVRHADTSPEQAHVVVNLGDGADRGPRVAVG